MPEREWWNTPALELYQSDAVTPGTAVRFGDNVFLNPRDMHTLRSKLMNEPDPVFPEGITFTKHQAKRLARRERTRQLPPVAKWGAAVVMVSVVVFIVYGCTTAANNGRAYDECIQQIAQEQGHDAAELAMREGECR